MPNRHAWISNPQRRWVTVSLAVLSIGGALVALLILTGEKTKSRVENGASSSRTPASVLPESSHSKDPLLANAQKYCQACHPFPEPALLDKASWGRALREMAVWLGVFQIDFASRADGEILREAHIFPNSPILPQADWELILKYYRDESQGNPLRPSVHRQLPLELKGFRVRRFPMRERFSRICLLTIDSLRHRLYVGEANNHALHIFDPNGNVGRRVTPSSRMFMT